MNPRQHPKALLETYGIRPQKRLGQNFLVDKRALERIVEAADLYPQDTVLEIGPGLGALTFELAKRAKKVIAIEKDPKMVEILKETLKGYNNVEIIQGDILKQEIRPFGFAQGESTKSEKNPKSQNTKYKILNTRYEVVANLPYYITFPVIRKFLEAPRKPKLMVLMVQKEVAQRICARPPDMNLLAVSVQFYGEPKIVSYVKRTSFWPQPDVDSAILRITPNNAEPDAEPRRFFTLVRAGFKQPRKQLQNNLKALGLSKEQLERLLQEEGVQPTQRAETLGVETWIKLAESLEKRTIEQ